MVQIEKEDGEMFGLSDFLCDGEDVYQTYCTSKPVGVVTPAGAQIGRIRALDEAA